MTAGQDSGGSMRIFVFGNRGYMSKILPDLIAGGHVVVGLCTKPPERNVMPVRRWGGWLLRRLGLRSEDHFTYRDPVSGLPHPANLAARHGIPVLSSKTLRTPDFQKQLRQLAPDLILVAGFHRLIPEAVYALAGRMAVNLHPSLLPRHRGGTPSRWVIRHGDAETGITAHLLAADFDTGDMLLQRNIPVADMDDWGTVEAKLLDAMPAIALEVVRLVATGAANPRPQRESGDAYEKSYGWQDQQVDWSLSGDEIRRTALAIRPKSGAIAHLAGVPVCLWDVVPVQSGHAGAGAPGEVIGFDDEGRPTVACGDGAVALRTILRFGKLRSGRELTGRFRLSVGARFDPPPSGPEQ
jgi:methionyl-tRNA formyltransferase